MKESMRKPVLFFMDLMVVFLTVILTIELIAIAGFTFPFMETGHRTSAFLRRIQDQEYQKCVEYYYENEANGVEPDEELKELVGHTHVEVIGGVIVGLLTAGLFLLFM